MRYRGPLLLLIIGAATLTIRALLDSSFRNSTLLYLVVPFIISVALYGLTKPSGRSGLGWQYLNHLRTATIVFLATSVLLFEGFLCVLMFMPIYYVAVTVGYLFRWMFDRDGGARTLSWSIPALVLVLAVEGLTPATTPSRTATATWSTIADADPATLQANMAKPIVFPPRGFHFFSMFPLPDQIHSGSLVAGDVHRLRFTYKKWFLANYSRGWLHLRIDQVSPRHIRTKVIRNDAYLSHYMEIDGTDVWFDPLPDGRTRVTLTIRYRRLLDPAWYFAPMQQLAAEQSARYLVQSVILRQPREQVRGT